MTMKSLISILSDLGFEKSHTSEGEEWDSVSLNRKVGWNHTEQVTIVNTVEGLLGLSTCSRPLAHASLFVGSH